MQGQPPRSIRPVASQESPCSAQSGPHRGHPISPLGASCESLTNHSGLVYSESNLGACKPQSKKTQVTRFVTENRNRVRKTEKGIGQPGLILHEQLKPLRRVRFAPG